METCDVLIIGGGPAGSSCARQLHEAGLDVIVADKCSFPRDKICAGWITPAVVEELNLDLDHYRQGRVCQEIQGFRTGSMDGSYAYNDYNRPVSYGIRRYEFDHYLLSHSGARLMLGKPVTEIKKHTNHWIVNNNIKAEHAHRSRWTFLSCSSTPGSQNWQIRVFGFCPGNGVQNDSTAVS